LTTSNISFIDGTPILNYNLFIVEIGLIFFGSLYNEILLDITDIKGDKINNINTLPVIIGKKNTLIIECIIITFNMISSFLLLLNNYDVIHAILLELCFIPLIYDLYNIIKNDLDDFYIKKAVSNLNITLFLSLIYICSLSII
jgi:4-hydroxybenzoate polyprenyltransferase